MNLSPLWVGWLEEAGFGAVHWSDVGAPRAKDTEIFEWARQNEHVIQSLSS
jgi:predicted nuclease of predicted toxin-antitoxin system